MAQILDAARRELTEHGADGLSLRAVAREVGMVSSAVYRYVPSRDDLLTALIIEAYNAIGDVVERAAAGRGAPGRRFVHCCEAIRRWGGEHPHEFALLYGSPVPGYQAPQTTVTPAARVPVALLALVEAAYGTGALEDPAGDPPVSRVLAGQCEATRQAAGLTLPDPVLLRALAAWTGVYGFIGFELGGQLVGTFEPADAAAAYTFRAHARQIGFSQV